MLKVRKENSDCMCVSVCQQIKAAVGRPPLSVFPSFSFSVFLPFLSFSLPVLAPTFPRFSTSASTSTVAFGWHLDSRTGEQLKAFLNQLQTALKKVIHL